MSGNVEKSVSVVLGLAALVIVGLEVRREFVPRPGGPPGRQSAYLPEWRTMLPSANIIGDANAPVIVTVFTDFQCPFCRRFHDALAMAAREYPNSIATAVIHLPLAGHPHADAAARAAECAGVEGRFARAVDNLYAGQDSIGKLPWSEFALGTGVNDTVAFAGCMADTAATRKVRLGSALAAKEGFNATPTVIINGWRYGVPPADTELVRAVGDILRGKRPYKGFPKSELASP